MAGRVWSLFASNEFTVDRDEFLVAANSGLASVDESLPTVDSLPATGHRSLACRRCYQRGGRLSMKACTPSSAASSIMLQAMVRAASS